MQRGDNDLHALSDKSRATSTGSKPRSSALGASGMTHITGAETEDGLTAAGNGGGFIAGGLIGGREGSGVDSPPRPQDSMVASDDLMASDQAAVQAHGVDGKGVKVSVGERERVYAWRRHTLPNHQAHPVCWDIS